MSRLSPLVDSSQVRSWMVCESGDRWLTASQRFVSEQMPSHLSANIFSIQPAAIRPRLVGQSQAVVLWEITTSNVAASFGHVAALSLASSRVLQIAAVRGLTDRNQIALTELGIRAIIGQPEHLPGLAKLVHRYFVPRSR